MDGTIPSIHTCYMEEKKMIHAKKVTMKAAEIAAKVEREGVRFDLLVQRGYVWEKDIPRKSLLIHSLIAGYPIPPIYAVKDEDGKTLAIVDGQQRLRTIAEFFADGFALENVPPVVLEDGRKIALAGLKFSELEDGVRNALENARLIAEIFDSLEEDEIREIFFRINFGKPLTQVELTRVKARAIAAIAELKKHPLFAEAISDVGRRGYHDEDIIMKAHALLFSDMRSLTAKDMRPYVEQTDITSTEKEGLHAVFNMLVKVHGFLMAEIARLSEVKGEKRDDERIKLLRAVSKRIYTRTHLVSILPMIARAIEEGKTPAMIAGWLATFFHNGKGASVDIEYNLAATQSSGSESSVKKRLGALEASYDAHFNPVQVDDAQEEMPTLETDDYWNEDMPAQTDEIISSILEDIDNVIDGVPAAI